MEPVKTIHHNGRTINIFQDECIFSPRENDNICIFHIAHRRYSFGDKNYNDAESIHAAEAEARQNGSVILPLYMYDHSGQTISLNGDRYPYNDRWDAGQVGFVEVPKKAMLENWGKKNFTQKLKAKAVEVAESEVEEMDSFMRGEVYGYSINDVEDSCWGFIGDIKYCIEEAKSVVDDMNKKEQFCQHSKKLVL
jgi:hypothetical protein